MGYNLQKSPRGVSVPRLVSPADHAVSAQRRIQSFALPPSHRESFRSALIMAIRRYDFLNDRLFLSFVVATVSSTDKEITITRSDSGISLFHFSDMGRIIRLASISPAKTE